MTKWSDSVEVFYHDGERYSDDDCWSNEDGEPLEAGWYYWSCLPGCMPDCDPYGPFETEEDAFSDAQENWGDDEKEDQASFMPMASLTHRTN